MTTWGGATGGGGATPYWGCPIPGGGKFRSAAFAPIDANAVIAIAAARTIKFMTTSCCFPDKQARDHLFPFATILRGSCSIT
jgi:hypothetical protein